MIVSPFHWFNSLQSWELSWQWETLEQGSWPTRSASEAGNQNTTDTTDRVTESDAKTWYVSHLTRWLKKSLIFNSYFWFVSGDVVRDVLGSILILFMFLLFAEHLIFISPGVPMIIKAWLLMRLPLYQSFINCFAIRKLRKQSCLSKTNVNFLVLRTRILFSWIMYVWW